MIVFKIQTTKKSIQRAQQGYPGVRDTGRSQGRPGVITYVRVPLDSGSNRAKVVLHGGGVAFQQRPRHGGSQRNPCDANKKIVETERPCVRRVTRDTKNGMSAQGQRRDVAGSRAPM